VAGCVEGDEDGYRACLIVSKYFLNDSQSGWKLLLCTGWKAASTSLDSKQREVKRGENLKSRTTCLVGSATRAAEAAR
jgi:hypothetical protein